MVSYLRNPQFHICWNVVVTGALLLIQKSVDVVYLDYANAFDYVVHNKLLINLARKISCVSGCSM